MFILFTYGDEEVEDYDTEEEVEIKNTFGSYFEEVIQNLKDSK